MQYLILDYWMLYSILGGVGVFLGLLLSRLKLRFRRNQAPYFSSKNLFSIFIVTVILIIEAIGLYPFHFDLIILLGTLMAIIALDIAENELKMQDHERFADVFFPAIVIPALAYTILNQQDLSPYPIQILGFIVCVVEVIIVQVGVQFLPYFANHYNPKMDQSKKLILKIVLGAVIGIIFFFSVLVFVGWPTKYYNFLLNPFFLLFMYSVFQKKSVNVNHPALKHRGLSHEGREQLVD